MRVKCLVIFFIFLGFSSVLGILNKFWEHLSRHVDFIYKIHPLVVIVNRERVKSLLSQSRIKDNGDVLLNPWEQVHLFCAGTKTHIAKKTTDQLKLDVAPDPKDKLKRFFSFPYKKFPKEELSQMLCLSPKFAYIREVINKITKQNVLCGDGKGILLQVGFNVYEFVQLYEICFDRTENISAIYSTHDLIGTWLLFPENLQLSNMLMTRFTKPELLNFTLPMRPFHPDWQAKLFKRIFSKKADFYLRLRNKDPKNRLIVAAPLIPPGDFYYLPTKTATYSFESSMPTFISIQKGNLYVIEVIGRILAMQTNLLKVTSGSFGKLTLLDDEKKEKEIYMDTVVIDGKLQNIRPLAKYLYKIFHDPVSKRGIAFITMNNPYFKVADTDFPCRNIMDKFIKEKEVIFSADPSAGFTICCDVWNLLETLNYLPTMNLSGGILTFDEKHFKFLFDQLKLPRELLQVSQ